jgi:hypothetical protein
MNEAEKDEIYEIQCVERCDFLNFLIGPKLARLPLDMQTAVTYSSTPQTLKIWIILTRHSNQFVSFKHRDSFRLMMSP